MKITVIGCGRWGSMIAYYLNSINHEVTLYGRAGSANLTRFAKDHCNDFIAMPSRVKLCSDLSCVLDADIILISINSQGLAALMQDLAPFNLKDTVLVLCMKGIEANTGKRLSEIVSENTDSSNAIAVWLGPGHVQELYNGIPNCMVIDSESEDTKRLIIDAFSSQLIRFYFGCDLLGNEIGAAAKNVIGIAAGMLDGLRLSTLKGALMTRGTREISRLIEAMGGNPLSAYGLCHLGDYEATVFSKYSNNRMFGEEFVKGREFPKLAEGCHTFKALMLLSAKHNVDLPICSAVYKLLYEGHEPKTTFWELFGRSLKAEF